jgi:hypothetical protein
MLSWRPVPRHRGSITVSRFASTGVAVLVLACQLVAAGVRAEPAVLESSIVPDDLFDEGPTAPQVIYRYRNAEGRTVFTNFEDTVPADQRAKAVVDLSHVSLNTEIGSEIDARLERQHAALMQSDYCKALRADARAGALAQLWHDYAPLIVCGGMLLLFVCFTPFALKRIGAPVWAKTLTMAIPALALAGLVMFGMTEGNRMVVELNHQVRPCVKETWDRVAEEPAAVAKHARLVQELQSRIQAVQGLDALDGLREAQELQGIDAER